MSAPHPPATTGDKLCPRCQRVLRALAFGVDKKRADGLQCWCRECHREADAHRYAKVRRPKYVTRGGFGY